MSVYSFFGLDHFLLYLPAVDRGESGAVLDDPKRECISLGGSGGGAFSWYSLLERLICAGDFACLRRTGGGDVILFKLKMFLKFYTICTDPWMCAPLL